MLCVTSCPLAYCPPGSSIECVYILAHLLRRCTRLLMVLPSRQRSAMCSSVSYEESRHIIKNHKHSSAWRVSISPEPHKHSGAWRALLNSNRGQRPRTRAHREAPAWRAVHQRTGVHITRTLHSLLCLEDTTEVTPSDNDIRYDIRRPEGMTWME